MPQAELFGRAPRKRVHRVLDSTCGNRSMWFDKASDCAVYVDRRQFRGNAGDRLLVVAPDVVADFRALPFPDGRFSLVVFDPPHLLRSLSPNANMLRRYGRLDPLTWRDDLRAGFAECVRVLRDGGVLIFKWGGDEVPEAEVLSLCPLRAMFGQHLGRYSSTLWAVFLKDDDT